MTAVAGNHDGIRTRGLDLLHFATTIIDAFLIVTGDQGAAAAAAAELIHARGVEVDPILDALIQDPAGFVKIAVPEHFLGATSVITGVMVGGHAVETRFIQLNSTIFDIAYQKVKNGDKVVLVECFREVLFEPGPGCQIGMTSFGPQQGIDF